MALQKFSFLLLLLVAATPAKAAVQCAMDKAPVITVTPRTTEVRYDFSRSSAQLSSVQTDTVSPFQPGTTTITEGLREDQPTIAINVGETTATYPDSNVFCIYYSQVQIFIDLHPAIYIASEWPDGRCRDAIIEHEQKHIRVDHEIINEFAQKIGNTVQNAVNETGTIGPLNLPQMGMAQTSMNDHIESAVKSQELPMFSEMRAHQAQVDSLGEYERVQAICRQER